MPPLSAAEARQRRRPAPAELVLDGGFSIDEVVAVLATRDRVEVSATASRDRVLLDTFDRRLDARGITVELAKDGAITIDDGGERFGVAATSPARADRLLTSEIAGGLVRDRLAALIDPRALLPQARIRSRRTPVVVRNRDMKIVVRLAFEVPRLVHRGQADRELSARVSVIPVLGYPDDFDRIARLLTSVPGLTPTTLGIAAEALGPPPVGPWPVIRASDPSIDALLALCRHLAETIEANLAGTIADLDTEFLHDLRVAVRRTRSILRELRAVLPAEMRTRARADLRWIQQVTGPTRDLDVQLLSWSANADPALAPLRALLGHKRADVFRAMRRNLRGRRYDEAWGEWRKALADPVAGELGPDAATPIGAVAGARVRAVYRRMVRDGSAIVPDTPAEALHDLRKRGKELRYLLELFGPAWPDDQVGELLRTVKRLQDVLGRFQDGQVEATYLRSLAPELARGAGGPEALIALGLHLERLQAEQATARMSFSTVFGQFAGPTPRRTVKRTFAR